MQKLSAGIWLALIKHQSQFFPTLQSPQWVTEQKLTFTATGAIILGDNRIHSVFFTAIRNEHHFKYQFDVINPGELLISQPTASINVSPGLTNHMQALVMKILQSFKKKFFLIF